MAVLAFVGVFILSLFGNPIFGKGGNNRATSFANGRRNHDSSSKNNASVKKEESLVVDPI